MFSTVKDKIDYLFSNGFTSRYPNSQMVWERLRAGEKVLLKKEMEGRLAAQILAIPDKIGVYFQEIPTLDDFCRFHEDEI